MPVHDWNRVTAGTFHDFHLAWIAELRRALNGGLLPRGYYALAEQVAGDIIPDPLMLQRSQDDSALDGLREDSDGGTDASVLTVTDSPPRVSVTATTHEAITVALWAMVGGTPYLPRADRPLTLAAYAVRGPGLVTAYVEPLSVGAPLPDMPLFLAPDHYVNVPLEHTYHAAWQGVPERWRRVVEPN